jgi:hypothetical protein
LRLGNHHAKDVLKSLTLYVDGDGYCFVGIEQLADDCELSPDTVRRRLVWLDEIGAISRQSQWIDANMVAAMPTARQAHHRSDPPFGRRDQDEIEARARGEVVDGDVSREVSPSSQQGLNSDVETVSPAPALASPRTVARV